MAKLLASAFIIILALYLATSLSSHILKIVQQSLGRLLQTEIAVFNAPVRSIFEVTYVDG